MKDTIYTITITKEESVPVKKSVDRFRTELITDEQIKRMDYWKVEEKTKSDKPPTYDVRYYETIDSTEIRSSEILKQKVESLDLNAVIKAINSL